MKQMRFHLLCGVILAGLLTGCAGVNKVLRSGNSELIYQKAIELYQTEKWSRASTLFDAIQHLYDGSAREDSIAYFNAHCKFKAKEWDPALNMLHDFRQKFGRSIFIEDAEGLLTLCTYYMTAPAIRDQTMTLQARMSIKEFIARYPNSKQIENFRKMDAELLQRLHDKAYYNAYTYYKIGRYQSAVIALQNALKQYPESNHREQIMYLITVAGHKLASNSVIAKQTDRYLSMLDSYYSFIEEFPESSHIKEMEQIARQAKDHLDKNNKENQK